MQRDQKIEKINAYKKLIEQKKLPKIPEESKAENPDDPSTWSVEKQIHAEFTSWAEAQLENLLGEGKDESTDFLSEEEKIVLKAYAQRLIKQINNKQAPQQQPQSQKAQVETQVPRKPVTPVRQQSSGGSYEEQETDPNQPLGNRIKIRKGQSIEDALEALDRMGPKF